MRLRLGLSQLNENKFRHKFQECINPLCSFSRQIEDKSHYLLHCNHFTFLCINLMNNVKHICDNLEILTNNNKITLHLARGSCLVENKNKTILQPSITYT